MSKIVNDNETVVAVNEERDDSLLNFQFLIKTFILNWQWFLLSLIITMSAAMIYVRYSLPVYQVSAKVLIKDEDNTSSRGRSNQIMNTNTLGILTSTDGFDNELEILKSKSLAEETVLDLKLYVNYYSVGKIIDVPVYDETPVLVDLNKEKLEVLEGPVKLHISKDNNIYNVQGVCMKNGAKQVFKGQGKLPFIIKSPVGTISLVQNPRFVESDVKKKYIANIYNPKAVINSYVNIGVEPLSKTTSIAVLTRNDLLPERAKEYLKHLVTVYNRQANEDKNIIAVRTEEFINQRLEKINAELGSTDGAIERYKRNNNIIDAASSAQLSLSQSNEADISLRDINTQIMLMQSLKEYMQTPTNKYQTLPSNVGLKDPSAASLIGQYNQIALERSRVLRSASEHSPVIQELTSQLDALVSSINGAIDQSKRGLEIQKKAIMSTYGKYTGKLSQTPEQERFLTEIGRQQTVKSSLYIMLLQKREENSITLAATSDKGRLIDEPAFMGKVKPKTAIIMLIALLLGIGIPLLILILKELLRYRIEGRQDVEKLTDCPIIADIAMANESIKAVGDIVIKENQNNQMEEIFRGMRTNLQFILKESQNVIMFTSSVSGEGKTFVAGNLATSFAFLGKKVLLVGLDIRRPRLSHLFGMDNKKEGITTLLTKDSVSTDDVLSLCMPSGVNKNLDLFIAGPIPPNPSELLTRSTLKEIFDILRKEYDYVIVDTAPVGLVTDTLHIGKVADATVMVCRADYTEKSSFSMINDFAENNKLPNVSIVVNGVDMSKKKYGYAYGYGKYGKYGKSTYRSYTHGYGSYGYQAYGYGLYSSSHYSNPNDNSIRK
jgi:capsular exopolysaccharide synthesis family protein